MSNQVLGPASARWNDYVGTVAADDADALLNSRSVYELADIDRDRWTILGFYLNVDATAKVTSMHSTAQSMALASRPTFTNSAVPSARCRWSGSQCRNPRSKTS